MDFNILDLDRIRSSDFVRGMEFHSKIASTNDRAGELVSSRAIDCPFLVCADKQTAGRGRGSNRWWTGQGALAFSIVIDAARSGLAFNQWPQVALASGLAVCQAIEKSMPEATVRLKWPNDVYLNEKKASGILVEAPTTQSGHLILGIGVNVNNTFATAPEELRMHGISMADLSGSTFNLTDVLLAVLERLGYWLSTLSNSQQTVLERWRTYCLLAGRRVCLSAGSRQIAGICRGIDDEGRLLLATETGIESCHSGTVISFG